MQTRNSYSIVGHSRELYHHTRLPRDIVVSLRLRSQVSKSSVGPGTYVGLCCAAAGVRYRTRCACETGPRMSNPTLKQSQSPGRNPWLPASFVSRSTLRFSLPSVSVFSQVSLSSALPHPAQKNYITLSSPVMAPSCPQDGSWHGTRHACFPLQRHCSAPCSLQCCPFDMT